MEEQIGGDPWLSRWSAQLLAYSDQIVQTIQRNQDKFQLNTVTLPERIVFKNAINPVKVIAMFLFFTFGN